MDRKQIEVMFDDYTKEVVTAFNERDAEILAQAERLKKGECQGIVLSFKRINKGE